MEHELKHGFQRDHVRKGAQRIVFAQRMTGEIGRPDIGTGFAQTRGLGKGHGGERHLRELGKVEQTFRMTVGYAVGGQLLRIIAYDGENREAEPAAGDACPHAPIRRGRSRIGRRSSSTMPCFWMLTG